MALRIETMPDEFSGHQHRLALAVPDGAPGPQGWPLLCLLDGDWTWPLLHGNPLLENVAVLALGYGADRGTTSRCRAYDYTPPDWQGRSWPDPRVPAWQGGGAPAFTRLLQMQILPWLFTHAAIDRHRLSLFGHSYAGLYVLYALARTSLPFMRLIAASPSIWWHDGIIQRYLDEAPPRAARRRLDIVAGRDEAWYPQPAHVSPGKPREGGVPTLPALQRLAQRLRHGHGWTVCLHALPGAGHGDVLCAATRLALALCAGKRDETAGTQPEIQLE